MPLEGLEPSHPAPEAGALSPELQGQRSFIEEFGLTPDAL